MRDSWQIRLRLVIDLQLYTGITSGAPCSHLPSQFLLASLYLSITTTYHYELSVSSSRFNEILSIET